MRLPMPVLFLLLAAAFAVLVALGVWQLQRNEWKQDLIAESHARTDAPPLEVLDASGYGPDEVEYRRVEVVGTPRFEDAMFLANRARSSIRGEEIVVPVQPADGGAAVLVNMGWIPDNAREQVMPDLEAATGGRVQGLAVDISGRSGNRIPSGSWSNLDAGTMSEALGYPVAQWVVIAGEERAAAPSPSDPLPVSGWQRVQNTTPHIEYALTWFGIAVALAAVAFVRLVVAPRREAGGAVEAPPAPSGSSGARERP